MVRSFMVNFHGLVVNINSTLIYLLKRFQVIYSIITASDSERYITCRVAVSHTSPNVFKKDVKYWLVKSLFLYSGQTHECSNLLLTYAGYVH